ncbi:hypothetical protein BO82DRAFT_89788 [Aspergillus uvarum CBS 121591]|uniref:Uncharacterized protein n=1 Tax=Aspergillus uvarum CBS 121591 TaxID=1448315 RepID=A0A319CPR5_9EURO|nr:hypothetical protein BO82DRAFT_89788 [Aspergillus uvarum CBS 121591]PYH86580.1 hypothetical protein BO82DRAFT_89788 [Aspergillus uvarum CBS 121591]
MYVAHMCDDILLLKRCNSSVDPWFVSSLTKPISSRPQPHLPLHNKLMTSFHV